MTWRSRARPSGAARTSADDVGPVRVLQVFGAMNRGGAELRTLDVMRRLDRREVGLEFVALSGQAGVLDDEIRRLGSTVHYCRLDAGFPLAFARLVRARRAAVVHAHVFLTSAVVLAAARLGGARRRIAHFRSTTDGMPDTVRRRTYRAVMRRMMDRVATDLVGVSAGALAGGWSSRWADDPRCQVIYNGVDVDAYAASGAGASIRAELGLPADAAVAVHLARFDPVKHHPFTAEVLAATPGLHVAFVGLGGADRERATRARLAALGCAERAHFVGERTDVARWLAGADVSLLPSTIEGLPGVVLESLAAGTPVIANDLSGAREIAARVPGVTIVDVARGPAAWADAVRRALGSGPTARAALRAALADSVFTLEHATAAHRALWLAGATA